MLLHFPAAYASRFSCRLFVLHLVGDESAGVFVHGTLFMFGFELVLFLYMALLQRVEGFEFALRVAEIAASGLRGQLALFDGIALLGDGRVEFVDEFLKIAQQGRIHALLAGGLQAILIVLAVLLQDFKFILRLVLLFVELAEFARSRFIIHLRQIQQGLQFEFSTHIDSRQWVGSNRAASCSMLEV